MRLTVLGFAVLAAASALGAGYITSARLPDGTTKTFQDEGARQEIQGILSQKYLKPESVKAGDNVFVTTNAAGEVTISAVTGTESDFTTNNTVLVNTIEAVAPMPGDYANVSNKAVNAFQKSGGTVTGDVTTHNLTVRPMFGRYDDGYVRVRKDSAFSSHYLYIYGNKLSKYSILGQEEELVGTIQLPDFSNGGMLALTNDLCAKQDILPYPTNAIPYAALAQAVQTSLDKADTALQTAPVTSVNNKTGAVVLAASDIGALGNTDNQNLNGDLTFWGGNLAFVFEDAVLTPVIYLWNGVQRLEFPMQSGTLALTSDIPSVAGLAPLASPAFTGTPTAPTPATGDNSTNIATTAFVQSALSSISVNPLAGNKYDFSTNADVYRAVKDIVEALGGSVTNFPAIP